MTSLIDRLKANGADANHPASVQRHTPPNLSETEVFQRHIDKQNEQSRVDAHFQAQENFLKHGVEPLHNSDWCFTVPDDYRKWDTNQQLGYLYKMLCAANNKDGNPEHLHVRRDVFEQALNELAGDVPHKIINLLSVAFDHPDKIAEINVDHLINVKGSYKTWITGQSLNHRKEKSSSVLQVYDSEPVDCDMDHVKGLDRDGRAALRAAINGDFKTADKLLTSKRCMEWTNDLVQSIKDGATVTQQTIESLNRMRKTDGASNVTGKNLKSSEWSESPDGDVKQRSNGVPRMDWFKWK